MLRRNVKNVKQKRRRVLVNTDRKAEEEKTGGKTLLFNRANKSSLERVNPLQIVYTSASNYVF
jgi:hypothetical protein